MSRSTKILYRVRRNLRQFSTTKIRDSEIYDEMQMAQRDIVTIAKPLKGEIELDLVEDTFEYDLSAENIALVDEIKTPSTYKNDIDVIDRKSFLLIQKTTFGSSVPLYATYFNKNLWLHPAPGASPGTLTLYVYKKEPDTTISKTTEPDIGKEWDKAIEFYATAQILTGQERSQYLGYYQGEIDKNAKESYTEFNDVLTTNLNW